MFAYQLKNDKCYDFYCEICECYTGFYSIDTYPSFHVFHKQCFLKKNIKSFFRKKICHICQENVYEKNNCYVCYNDYGKNHKSKPIIYHDLDI